MQRDNNQAQPIALAGDGWLKPLSPQSRSVMNQFVQTIKGDSTAVDSDSPLKLPNQSSVNSEVLAQFGAVGSKARADDNGCYRRAQELGQRFIVCGCDPSKMFLIFIEPKNGCLEPRYPGVKWSVGHCVLEADGMIWEPLEDRSMPWKDYRDLVFGNQPIEMHRDPFEVDPWFRRG
jgi:hypothetical protein